MKRLLWSAVLLMALLVTTACPENPPTPPQGSCPDGYWWDANTEKCIYVG